MVIVALQQIVHSYRRGSATLGVLAGIDLTIERGDFVAIMGPSGAGKSTLLHILGCLLRPDGGSYRFAGRDVTMLAERDLAAIRSCRIGHIFQMFHLLPHGDVRQNVGLPFLYHDRVDKMQVNALVERAIRRVGLWDRRDHRPAELSGGELQRVAIARALAPSPDLLLADEPTGNLDRRTSSGILELLSEMHADGHTIVMVTHDPAVAARARRTLILDNGVLGDG